MNEKASLFYQFHYYLPQKILIFPLKKSVFPNSAYKVIQNIFRSAQIYFVWEHRGGGGFS